MIKMPRGKFNVIVGGQAGSEAKGKLSGWLCQRFQPDVLVMTASPNAGHTVVMDGGAKMVSYHLPIGAVMCSADILLTAASVINPRILREEIVALGISPNRIYIDPRAAVIGEDHISREKGEGMSDIGSTLQGIGACRREKMRRDGTIQLAKDKPELHGMISTFPVSVMIQTHLGEDSLVLCEMTQGFDLDLEHGIHPRYCTSKMINPSMAMAEAGVPPSSVGSIFGVIRPFPIRVNNRTGTSGPYADAEEIDWTTVARICGYPGPISDFGEITTTTKLPRRVFTFSWERYELFVRICAPTSICLQFANYLDWSVYRSHRLTDPVIQFIRKVEDFGGVPVDLVGTGPENQWMVEVIEDVQ